MKLKVAAARLKLAWYVLRGGAPNADTWHSLMGFVAFEALREQTIRNDLLHAQVKELRAQLVENVRREFAGKNPHR